jgi:hypothetical protein
MTYNDKIRSDILFYFPIMEPSTEQNNHLQIKENKIHI